jgi:hypothetical protein
MERVELVVYGRRALVDKDMVKKVLRKEALVTEGRMLQEAAKVATGAARVVLEKNLMDSTMKLIRLNRTMRSTFLSFL